MGWRLAGLEAGSCNCLGLCPCTVDEEPNNGECRGAVAFSVTEGHLGSVGLGGISFALYYTFSSRPTAGGWRVGLVVDDAASDEQADAIERIVTGKEGGDFANFAALYDVFLGVERAHVLVGDGDPRRVTIGGGTDFTVDLYRGADGAPTTMKNAAFGVSAEFPVGKAKGSSSGFGMSYEPGYGEYAEFEMSG